MKSRSRCTPNRRCLRRSREVNPPTDCLLSFLSRGGGWREGEGEARGIGVKRAEGQGGHFETEILWQYDCQWGSREGRRRRLKGSRSSASTEQAENGRVRGVASEEEGLLSSARQCPLNVGRSLEQRVLHAYSSWRTGGEIEGKLKGG